MFALLLAAVLAEPPRDVRSRELLSSVMLSGSCERSCRGDQRLLGTGEIVGRRGNGQLLVLTAKHVVSDMMDPRVYVRNGVPEGTRAGFALREGRGIPAQVLAQSPDTDLALVAFRPRASDAYALATLATDGAVQSGDVVGGPNGALWTVSPFHAIAEDGEDALVFCATCGPGDSGGGVFDGRGALAGILISQQVLVEGDEPPAAGRRSSRFKIVPLADVRTFVASAPLRAAPPGAGGNDPWARFERNTRAPAPWSRFGGSEPAGST